MATIGQKLLNILVILTYCTLLSNARNKCRKVDEKSMKNVDFDKLSGHWNLMYINEVLSKDATCSYIDYRKAGPSIEFDYVINSTSKISGRVEKCAPSPDGPKLNVFINGTRSNMWVMATDYYSFLMVYCCVRDVVNGKKQVKDSFKILSQGNAITESVLEELETKLDSVADDIVLSPINRANCDKNSTTNTGQQSSTTAATIGSETDKVLIESEPPIFDYDSILTSSAVTTSTTAPTTSSSNSLLTATISTLTTSSAVSSSLSSMQNVSLSSTCKNLSNKETAVDFDLISGKWVIAYANAHSEDKECVEINYAKSIGDTLLYTMGNGGSNFQGRLSRVNGTSFLSDGYHSSWHFLDVDYSSHHLVYLCTDTEVNSTKCTIETYLVLTRDNRDKPQSEEQRLKWLNELAVISNTAADIAGYRINLIEGHCQARQPKQSVVDQQNLQLSSVVLSSSPAPIVAAVKCRDLKPMPGFNISQLRGVWYLLASDNGTRNCVSFEVSENNGTVREPALFLVRVNGIVEYSGFLKSTENNGELLKIVAGKPDNKLIALLVDEHHFVYYSWCPNTSTEHYGAYFRTNALSDNSAANILDQFIKVDIRSKVHLVDNVKCRSRGSHQCPTGEGVVLTNVDFKKISGKWYRVYSTDPAKCINFEFEKISAKLSKKRYFIKRQNTELLLTGWFRRAPNGEILLTAMEERDSLVHILATDYTNYFVYYRCTPNKDHVLDAHLLSRTREIRPEILELAKQKFNEIGIEYSLTEVDQRNCNYESDEELACRDLSHRAVRNVDLKHFHGTWYPILLNRPGTKCVRLQDNKKLMSDAGNSNYWYNLIDSNGLEGWGRIRLNEDGTLSELNAKLSSDHTMIILDTDYQNYQIYYQCSIINVYGEKRKIEDYGLMSRKPRTDLEVVERARKLFDDIGIDEIHPVDQENCNYRNISDRPGAKDYHCKNVANYSIKNVDISKLHGTWFTLYTNHPLKVDLIMNINATNNPSVVDYRSRIDNIVMNGTIREDETGALFGKCSDYPDELSIHILDFEYSKYIILYKCIEFDASYSKIESFSILSRTCGLDISLLNKARKIATDIGIGDNLFQVEQYQCVEDEKYATHVLRKQCTHFDEPDMTDVNFDAPLSNWRIQLTSVSDKRRAFDNYTIVKDSRNVETLKLFAVNATKNLVIHRNSGTRLVQLIGNDKFGIAAQLYADHQCSYAVRYVCFENITDGRVGAHEWLEVSTRGDVANDSATLSRTLCSVPPVTLAKVLHLVSSLKTVREISEVLNNSISTQSDTTNTATGDGNELYKDSVLKIVEQHRQENKLSEKSNDEVYDSLRKVCRQFTDQDIASVDFSEIAGNWTLDWTTYYNQKCVYDTEELTANGNSLIIVRNLKSEPILTLVDHHMKDSRLIRRVANGKRSIVAHLYANQDYRIVYSCDELEVNDVLTINEIIQCYSRANGSKPRDWYAYLNLFSTSVNQTAMAKISELFAHLVAVSKESETQTVDSFKNIYSVKDLMVKQEFERKIFADKKISAKSDEEVMSALNKTCKTFDDSELIDADFTQIAGHWNLDWINVCADLLQYDSILLAPNQNNNQLSIERILKSKPVQSGVLSRINGTRYIKENTSGRRERISLLWTDYTDYMVVHGCVETEINNQVTGIEVLLLYSRDSINKTRDLDTYIKLMALHLKPPTLSKVSSLIADLEPVTDSVIDEQIQTLKDLYENNLIGANTAEQIMIRKQVQGFIRNRTNNANRGDAEVFGKMAKICRRFDDNVLCSNLSIIIGRWNVDWCSYEYKIDKNVIERDASGQITLTQLHNNETVDHVIIAQSSGSKVLRKVSHGRLLISVLYADDDYLITYVCRENEYNGAIIAIDEVTFSSREVTTKPRELSAYAELLIKHLNPKILSRLSYLTACMLPISPKLKRDESVGLADIRSDGIIKLKQIMLERPVSEKSDREVHLALEKVCRHFDDTEINCQLNNISGKWIVDWSNAENDTTQQFDSIFITQSPDTVSITYFSENQTVSQGTVKYVNGSKKGKGVLNGRRSIVTILWLDDNNMYVHSCIENEINGVITGIEILRFYSRDTCDKSKDIATYFNTLSAHTNPVTLAKLIALVARLRSANKDVDDDALKIVQLLNRNLVIRNTAERQLNKVLIQRPSCGKPGDEVNAALNRVCRVFEKNEVKNLADRANGHWIVDWTSSYYDTVPFDELDIRFDNDTFFCTLFLKSAIISQGNFSRVAGNYKFGIEPITGRWTRGAQLLLVEDHFVLYICQENEINGDICGLETLLFMSRFNTISTRDLETYLDLLSLRLQPRTITKVSDLIQCLRPVHYTSARKAKANNIMNSNPVFSGTGEVDVNSYDVVGYVQQHFDEVNEVFDVTDKSDSEVFKLLAQNCFTVSETDAKQIIPNRLDGVWKVDWTSFINPKCSYDTLDIKPVSNDTFAITRNYGSQVLATGALKITNGSKFAETIISGRRGRTAVLWTDYIDNMVVYQCNENEHNGVFKVQETLRLMSRSNSSKPKTHDYYMNLLGTSLNEVTTSKLSFLFACLRQIHVVPNNSDHIEDRTLLVTANKTDLTNDSQECGNYDEIAQQNVDLSRLSGRWDAIFSSNTAWDRSCIHSIDTYNASHEWLQIEKHHGNSSHRVSLRRANAGRQLVFVDKIEFQSWILATDYSSYRLAYTCYVKELSDGKKQKIDLLRLYTRSIEAPDFDQLTLQILREKAASIGKTLEKINRTNCDQFSDTPPPPSTSTLTSSTPTSSSTTTTPTTTTITQKLLTTEISTAATEVVSVLTSEVSIIQTLATTTTTTTTTAIVFTEQFKTQQTLEKKCRKLNKICLKLVDLTKFSGNWHISHMSSPHAKLPFTSVALNSSADGQSLRFGNQGSDYPGLVTIGRKGGLKVIYNSRELKFFILDTDYDNYVLLYFCVATENSFHEGISLLIRDGASIDSESLVSVEAKSTEIGLRIEKFVPEIAGIGRTDNGCNVCAKLEVESFPTEHLLGVWYFLSDPCPYIQRCSYVNNTRYNDTAIVIETHNGTSNINVGVWTGDYFVNDTNLVIQPIYHDSVIAIVYICHNAFGGPSNASYGVFSRTRQLDADIRERIRLLKEQIGIPLSQEVSQHQCDITTNESGVSAAAPVIADEKCMDLEKYSLQLDKHAKIIGRWYSQLINTADQRCVYTVVKKLRKREFSLIARIGDTVKLNSTLTREKSGKLWLACNDTRVQLLTLHFNGESYSNYKCIILNGHEKRESYGLWTRSATANSSVIENSRHRFASLGITKLFTVDNTNCSFT